MLLRTFFLFAVLFVPNVVYAATASVSGPSQVQVGRTFQVQLKILGAKQVDTVRFIGNYPSDLLSYRGSANSTSLPTRSPATTAADSQFNFGGFTLEEPVNGDATAGTLTFKALRPGVATISLVDGTRLLSTGEDQLSQKNSFTIRIVEDNPPDVIPQTPPGEAQIAFESTSHPDEESWYNTRNVAFRWKFGGRQPVSYRLGFDQFPEGPAEEDYSSGTTARYEVQNDGVYYGHLIARYSATEIVRKDVRVQIDSVQPLPFAVSVDQTDIEEGTKNFVRFAAIDQASGIDEYVVFLNGSVATSTKETSYDVSQLKPGTYNVVVHAFDYADNRAVAQDRFIVLPKGTSDAKSFTPFWQWVYGSFILIGLLFCIRFVFFSKKQ